MNEVDRLERRIAQIQQNCEHEIEITEGPTLVESLVSGVFVGDLEGPADADLEHPNNRFTMTCLKCSARKDAHAQGICPKCLRPMGEARCLGAGSRKEYFGQEYLYFAAAIARCTSCSFAIARDEWDQ